MQLCCSAMRRARQSPGCECSTGNKGGESTGTLSKRTVRATLNCTLGSGITPNVCFYDPGPHASVHPPNCRDSHTAGRARLMPHSAFEDPTSAPDAPTREHRSEDDGVFLRAAGSGAVQTLNRKNRLRTACLLAFTISGASLYPVP